MSGFTVGQREALAFLSWRDQGQTALVYLASPRGQNEKNTLHLLSLDADDCRERTSDQKFKQKGYVMQQPRMWVSICSLSPGNCVKLMSNTATIFSHQQNQMHAAREDNLPLRGRQFLAPTRCTTCHPLRQKPNPLLWPRIGRRPSQQREE
jgi:hypothetical protein